MSKQLQPNRMAPMVPSMGVAFPHWTASYVAEDSWWSSYLCQNISFIYIYYWSEYNSIIRNHINKNQINIVY